VVDVIMILLFEEDEQEFKNLGLGVLKDALSCKVTEGLNDEYELAMEYPLNGQFCSSIKIGRLIYCKPNPYSAAQPFRIYDISKTLHRTISVSASHISYDLGGLPVVALKKGTLTAIIDELQNGCIVDNPFKFYTDILSDKTYEVTSPTNIRSILMSTSGSLVEKYGGEFLFDKFDVRFLTTRGENRGVQVRYGKNITDLKHDISYDNLYNGVYPFYHTETTSSTTTASGTFTKVYIVGTKPLQDGWLSYTSGGAAYHPIDTSPVQIATEGEYKDKVYCWNTNTQRYEEKIYNQSVTLVEGVISPDWIYIDWASFPIITCKAGKDGYFRTATDTSYGSEKKTGDVIFQGSITSSDTLSNIILYYSEVVPSSTSSTTTETTDVVNTEIDGKIIWLESDASKAMKYNRILPLDLTSYFTESPTSDTLKAKAEEYISKNKLGQIKLTTDVSFIDASSSVEASSLKDLEKVELGDTVKVVYEDQNIDVNLRVITTLYDVVKGRYEKITLGDKDSKLSGTSVQAGDNVSSLTNDSGYADVTTVKKLIADTVTADYLYSKNAELTNAQIQELSTVRINCTGIMEASQFSIDTLVAKLLTAENAEISKVLKAGEIKVSGDVDITSGSIKIYSNGGESYFIVDNEGNLTANSVDITGGNP
jgi:phage minor structural protein